MGVQQKKKGMLLILILLSALTGMVLIGAEIFQIKEITVLGNDKIVYNDIVNRSGIVYGDNIFKLDKELIEKRIEMDPYLDVVSIERKYPDRVIITVREREPAAIIPYLNSYFIIDKEGYILEIKSELGVIEYPIVQGILINSFVVGKRIGVNEEYQLTALQRILDSVYELELQDQISEIRMENIDDIYMVLNTGIQVRIGQALDVKKKLIWLTSEDVQKTINGVLGGVLDVSAASQPVFYPGGS